MRKNGRKLLSLALALVMVLGMAPAALAAEPTSGKCGDNLTWSLQNGTLTISGTGAMEDYRAYDEAPWYSQREKITSAAIGKGVTEIGDFAFDDTSLTSVVIPDGVTRIGSAAFQGCTSLVNVSIPKSVEFIGEAAFRQTPWIKSQGGIVVVNDVLLNYEGDDNIHVVTIPDSVTKIAAHAFIMRMELVTVNIPNGVTSIEDSAFFGCHGLREITIPDSVTRIGSYAFNGCNNLSSVTLSNSLTHIEEGTFSGCSSLTQISIPDNVVSIAEGAFSDCGLTSVTIPGSAALPDADPQSVEGAFSNCPNLANVTIQDGVSSIGIYAFMNSGLTSITIPSSVSGIGAAAFDGCDGLKDVYFTGTEAQWKAIAVERWNDPLLNAAIHCSGTAPVQPAPAIQFSDVKDSDYYHDAVYWAVANDIVKGTSPTTFTPDRTCTETEILTFLWRAAGKPASTAQLPFTVNTGLRYATDALRWAYEKGMIGAAFNQTGPCTRASAAKYIWQAAGSPAAAATSSFTDVPAGADYTQAVEWAVEKGVTKGTSDTAFTPDKTCTRAQIVTFLHRAYQ